MKVRIGSIVAIISILLFLFGCSGDPNEQANKLYTEASEALHKSKTEGNSYSDIYDSYKAAKDRIDRILSEYPSSNIAVDLSSGNVKIEGWTLSQFQDLEGSLKTLAKAEQFPLSTALLLAQPIGEGDPKTLPLAEIAGKYAEAGELSQALEIAKTIEDRLYPHVSG